ncbi:MAG: hypothetical protein HY961_06340 [Ignavibacteriae bacterium]|nr:hypothetical protein [Ignavibacteriota bacterium]
MQTRKPVRNQIVQSLSDEELVSEISSGNISALRELHKRYASSLRTFFVRAHPSLPDADLQLQEIFYKIWNEKLTFQKSRHRSIHSWLFALARAHGRPRAEQLADASPLPSPAYIEAS